MIRVALLKDVVTCTIEVRGPYTVTDVMSGQKLVEENGLRTAAISASEQGIHWADNLFRVSSINVVAQKEAAFFINGQCYRGDISFIRTGTSKLTVVNTLELEDYLKGVVPKEIPDRWPLEAIKAQAIVARTYTLYIKKQKKYPLYDLTSDIFSQMYGGQSAEKYRTSLAVERTKSLVLIYNQKTIPAYYHATCAGHTEDVGELWGGSMSPLQGVVCVFCKESPHMAWKRNLRLKDIQDKLNAQGYTLGLIKDIAIVERDQSQRIRDLKITTRDHKEVFISGKDFRNIIGPNLIKSNNYDIEMKGYFIDIYGKGWGHGVGLCQWGANFMAREGYSFGDILKYYYPGVEIMRYYDCDQSDR